MTTSVGNNLVFRSSFEKQILTGPNFIDWYRQLRLVLSTKENENYLEHPISEAPIAPPRQQVPPAAAAAHAAWVKGQKKVAMLMLLTMDLDIQWNLAHLEFHACKQEEGQSVSSYVLKMKGYIDNLEQLGKPIGQNLAVSLILVFLSKDYDSFVQNYNMHGMGKTVNELHAMLKLHEDTLPKKNANPVLHAIRAGGVQKNQKNKPYNAAKGGHGKGKSKMGYAPNNVPFAPKPKTPPPPKKDNPAKDAIFHQCGEIGHWRRNCPVYLAELIKRRSYLKELALQGLRGSKKLKPGALSLYVGDGYRAFVEAIRTYHLELPSGLVIVLNNCHYAPSITRGVISVSRLFDDGFINRFDENNVISVLKNNLVYFMAVPQDGIFEIDMSCSNTNDSSMYAISNRRAKINLDSSLLWHCRLGHISKKCIEKLKHDGLLNSIDIESLGKCVSCMSGKMARQPYSHKVERAKDLLGLIYTDVCGPFIIVSRQGANYFVTFTDDFSRYGYVYLPKHKHEVFETFKEHGIIAHCIPPYTPQHNGVSERRTRTLLDMGCEALVKHDTLTKPNKLDPRSFRCIFVGYPKETIGYSFYSLSENKVFVAKNAKFFKNDLIDLKASESVEDLELIQKEDTNHSLDTSLDHEEDDQEINEPQSDINPIRKFSRTRRASNRMCLYIDAEEHELGDLSEPANYKTALLDPESKKWLDVMNVEMQSMKDNDVWVLVELPPNARIVGSKWFFKKKTDMYGAIYVFKARLEAKGFTQTYGVDYEETFSLVADIRAIRILIAIAAYYDYEICFAMKDLGEAAYILGIKIYRDRSKRLIGLCQSAYIKKILKRYYMKNSKRGTIPMQKKLKLSKSQGASTPAEKQRMQNVPYALAIGSIIYAVRYAEYIAAFDASKKAVWIRKFISGLGIVLIIEEPIIMYCDNTRAIAIAKDDGVTKGARHFRAKVYYLRETIKLGDVKIEKIGADDNLADPFTKALAFPKHFELTKNIKMLPASSFM
uniref:Zinc finger, CCHC-type n=1 Tax=Tanacetum cinerariifolium TaxID=118510 RepID=A0A6L2J809_TANCI|nr:zinc finger, CCHC-type [Tanacetum cinerariifolium]